jgi:hypothetical protein
VPAGVDGEHDFRGEHVIITGLRRFAGRAAATVAAGSALALAFSGVALADTLQDTIADTGTGVTLVAGSGVSGNAAIRLIGNSAAGDPDPGCNIDTGENPLRLDIVTPAGVTANPDPLSINACGTDFPISLTAGSTAVSGHVTVTVLSGPAGGGSYVNQVDIPITVTQPNTKPTVTVTGVTNGSEYVVGTVPAAGCAVTDKEDGGSNFAASLSTLPADGLGSQTATCDYTDKGGLKAVTATATYSILPPPNTQPTVSVTGVENGANYEIGSVPPARCAVTDKEDGNSTKDAVVTGTLSHGLGLQTATCTYTDGGGLAADTSTATYEVVDTGLPTISHSLTPAGPNGAGWYDKAVSVHFDCHDAGSGIQSCEGDTTLGEGANQFVTGTATDWAGNTASDTASGINVDITKPTAAFTGGPSAGGTYYWGSVPAAPKCAGSDALSGLVSCTVDGDLDPAAIGTHLYTATATDKAGNAQTAQLRYEVKAWTAKGFYAPVDMGGVFNTVKGGSTVPVKFEVFAGSTELTDTSLVSLSAKTVSCSTSSPTDDIELTATGATSLRYDTTAGQYIYNWKTPTGAGTCYQLTMTAKDGSHQEALFKLK